VSASAIGRLRGQPWLFAGGLSLALLLVNIIADPNFAEPGNWPQHLATLAPLALVAVATTPAAVSGNGGLDLSIGPLAVMCNVLLVHWMLPEGLGSFWVSAPLLLAIGASVGILNGFLSTVLRYVPVIATLCVAFVIMGINEKVGAESIAAEPNWTSDLGESIGPIPGGLIVLTVPALIWLALRATAYHRNLYATGGNDVTAFSSGVNVTATRMVAYGLGGMFAAIAGIALTALVQSSQASQTNFYILVGLTAIALGGTSLGGGRGGLAGAYIGAAVLFLIQSLVTTVGVRPEWINVVYGLMLVVGVVVGARAGHISLRAFVPRKAEGTA